MYRRPHHIPSALEIFNFCTSFEIKASKVVGIVLSSTLLQLTAGLVFEQNDGVNIQFSYQSFINDTRVTNAAIRTIIIPKIIVEVEVP